MFKEQLAKLKNRLLGDKQRLEKELEDLAPSKTAWEAEGADEVADIVEEKINKMAVANVTRGRLKNIKTALTKFKSRNYGICENCKKEIDVKPLEVNPESKLCRECKLKNV